jgi:hypothetical protein
VCACNQPFKKPLNRKGAKTQRKRKGKKKQIAVKMQDLKWIVATPRMVDRVVANRSPPAFCHASTGFLCVSSAPLRLCGEDKRWIVAPPQYIDWVGQIGISRFLTRFVWFSLRFLCAFASLR